MSCLHLYRTKNKLKSHENVCKNHACCNIKMPERYNKIFKFTQNHKSMKIPQVIYEDTESLLEKIQVCDKKLTKSFTPKLNKTSGAWLFIIDTLFI